MADVEMMQRGYVMVNINLMVQPGAHTHILTSVGNEFNTTIQHIHFSLA